MNELPSPNLALQSIEAEQSVLGALLLDNNAIDRIHWLQSADFVREDHRILYATTRAILEAGKPVDVLLLGEALRARGELEKVGGFTYIGSLAINTPSAAHITQYAKLVRRSAQGRALQALAADLHASVTNHADPVQAAEIAADQALSILDDQQRGGIVHIGQAVGEAVDWLDAPEKGISTGYGALDAYFRLVPGELLVIAGRPAMGKSALALNIAEQVARALPAAVFSLEMTSRQIGVRSVRWHEHLTDRFAAVNRLFTYKLWIDESEHLTIGTLRVRLQRIKRKNGLALVVVDYIQLMTGEGDNRTQEIGSLSRGLKGLAKEFRIPIIATAQINRGVESRQDKRPMLSDLRESGDVEQDADIVLFLYRDDYYHEDSTSAGFAEVLIRKHREGKTGKAWLQFDAEYARFKDFAGAPPQAHRESRRSGTVKTVDFKLRSAGND